MHFSSVVQERPASESPDAGELASSSISRLTGPTAIDVIFERFPTLDQYRSASASSLSPAEFRDHWGALSRVITFADLPRSMQLPHLADALAVSQEIDHCRLQSILFSSNQLSKLDELLCFAYLKSEQRPAFLAKFIESPVVNPQLATLLFVAPDSPLRDSPVERQVAFQSMIDRAQEVLHSDSLSSRAHELGGLLRVAQIDEQGLERFINQVFSARLEQLEIGTRLIVLDSITKNLFNAASSVARICSQVAFESCFEVSEISHHEIIAEIFESIIEIESHREGALVQQVCRYLDSLGLCSDRLIGTHLLTGRWFDFELVTEAARMIPGSLLNLASLEYQCPGAAKHLHEKFGLSIFGRYPIDALINQYLHSSSESGVVDTLAIFTTVFDNDFRSFSWAYAIEEPHNTSQQTSPPILPLYHEFTSVPELARQVRRLNDSPQSHRVIQFNCHGNAKSFAISDDSDLLIEKIEVDRLARFLPTRGTDKLTLVFNCCYAANEKSSFPDILKSALSQHDIEWRIIAPVGATPLIRYKVDRRVASQFEIYVDFRGATFKEGNVLPLNAAS